MSTFTGNKVTPTMASLYTVLAVNAPTWVDAEVLAANTAVAHPVPNGANFVVFSASATFYANYSGAAASVPTGQVTNGAASELGPTTRIVTGLTSISLIAPSANTIVTMSFFQ
jgi:hypothetical protein